MATVQIKIEAARGIVSGGVATQATLTAAIAAAQLIGAGDASAEIDAIDTANVALIADSITVTVDTAVTRAQLLKALDAAYRYLTNGGGITS